MKTIYINGRRCVTTYDGWVVKVHREERYRENYHVQVSVINLLIALAVIAVIVAAVAWGAA